MKWAGFFRSYRGTCGGRPGLRSDAPARSVNLCAVDNVTMEESGICRGGAKPQFSHYVTVWEGLRLMSRAAAEKRGLYKADVNSCVIGRRVFARLCTCIYGESTELLEEFPL